VGKSPQLIQLVAALMLLGVGVVCFLGVSVLPETDSSKTTDLSILFEQAERVTNLVRPPETPPGKPIVVSAPFNYQRLAYDIRGITQGPFLALHRIVETYAFVEEAVPENELPPNPKLVDRYRYHPEWLVNPTPWRQLKVWKDHTYNTPPVPDEYLFAEGVSLGRLLIDLQEATLLDWEPIKLDSDVYGFLKGQLHDERYVYQIPEPMDKPRSGDYRLAYDGVILKEGHPQVLTILGARDFNNLVPFEMADGRHVLLVKLGDEAAMREVIGKPPMPLALISVLRIALPYGGGLLFVLAAILGVLAFRRRAAA
jgi:hypothetical protein